MLGWTEGFRRSLGANFRLASAEWFAGYVEPIMQLRLAAGRLGFCFFFQAEDGIRDVAVTGVQTCALPIWCRGRQERRRRSLCYASRNAQLYPATNLIIIAAGERRRQTGCPCHFGENDERSVNKIGRASCRERGEISGVGGEVKEKSTAVSR